MLIGIYKHALAQQSFEMSFKIGSFVCLPSLGAAEYRTAMTAVADGSFTVPVSDIIKAEDLNYIRTGIRLVVAIKVKCQNQDDKTISFTKDNRIVVE